jgi:WD40-like Beta Propeller Repeat
MTRKQRGAALLVLAAAMWVAIGTARAGDPLLRYYTIESEHFVVHYDHRLADVARRVAVVAERAHRSLAPALDHTPDGKTLINIVDDTDSANGFAGVLPRNAITLFVTAPNGFTELDDHEDWLYVLVAHEYTHILHLDTMSGLPNIYNRIFGKTWSPNQVMPRWIIEGIAVYEESKRSAGGRNRGSRFDQFIRIARHADKDMRLDEITGAPRKFPRGNAPYVYGSHFLRYIFDRFGEDALREMSHAAGAYPVPFAINRQIAKVVGRPFTVLYDDWKAYLRDRYGLQEMAAERRGLAAGRQLTTTAELNFFPQYTRDGKEIVWIQGDGYSIARVRALPVGGDQRAARDVVRLDAIGPFELCADGSIVFEQGGRLFRREYAFQDLFRWDARTGQTVRLTHGARARDPAVSPDGRRIAFSMNRPSQSVIAVMDAVPEAEPSIVWQGARYDQAYQPAWSPDGARIAFSAWRHGGFRDILVVELASGQVQAITADRAIDAAPVWSPDGKTLYFDSDRTGIANIFAYDLADGALWQVTNVLGGALQPALSPDGSRLVFQAAAPKGGYDLHELVLDRAAWLPAREHIDDRPEPRIVRDDEAAVSAPRRYRPLESLAPQAWTLQTVLGDAPSATIQTNGADAVGLHSYALSIGTNLETADLNIGASYGYGGFRQGVRLSAARTIATRGGFRIDGRPATYRQEDWSATLSTAIPFEARPESSWTLSFDYDVDVFRSVQEPMIVPDPGDRVPVRPLTDYMQAGLGMRIAYSRVRGTTFGLGPQYGFDASISLRLDHPALGATYRTVSVSYATQLFRRLWGETATLALRLVGSLRTGDLVRGGSFSLGGVPPQDVARAIVESTRTGITGYLRGYEPRTVVGNQFHLLNAEVRRELWVIERGLATLPLYIRRLHVGVLADVGTAFDTTFQLDRHLKKSLGGALRLDAFFGGFIPGTFEVGVSRGLDTGGITESWFLLTGSL